jgi:hypothetical protein
LRCANSEKDVIAGVLRDEIYNLSTGRQVIDDAHGWLMLRDLDRWISASQLIDEALVAADHRDAPAIQTTLRKEIGGEIATRDNIQLNAAYACKKLKDPAIAQPQAGVAIGLTKCAGYSRIFTLVKLDYVVNVRCDNIRKITAMDEALKFISDLWVRHVGKVDPQKVDKLHLSKHFCPKIP